MSRHCFVLMRKAFPDSEPYPAEVFLTRAKAEKAAIEFKAKDSLQAHFYIEKVYLEEDEDL